MGFLTRDEKLLSFAFATLDFFIVLALKLYLVATLPAHCTFKVKKETNEDAVDYIKIENFRTIKHSDKILSKVYLSEIW